MKVECRVLSAEGFSGEGENMRAVIISGGAVTDYDYIKAHIENNDMVICADSGYDHAKRMGIVPDVVVGDFDSIAEMPNDRFDA